MEERLSISSLLGSTPCAFIAGAVQEEAPLVHHGRARHCVRGRRRRRACTTAVLDIPSIRMRRACTKRPSASRATRRYEVNCGEPRCEGHHDRSIRALRLEVEVVEVGPVRTLRNGHRPGCCLARFHIQRRQSLSLQLGLDIEQEMLFSEIPIALPVAFSLAFPPRLQGHGKSYRKRRSRGSKTRLA